MRPASPLRWAAWTPAVAAAALLASGCPLAHDPYPEPASACTTDDECFPGETCKAGVCAIGTKLGCEPEFGRTYIFSTVQIYPEEEGFDLDGDGTIDNHLASSSLTPFVNLGFGQSIAGGDMIFLVDILDWTDPPTPDDPSVTVDIYVGVDADVPADPDNNVGGNGQFTVPAEQFDLNCTPTSKSDYASVTDGLLTGAGKRGIMPLASLGTLEFINVQFAMNFDEDFAGGEGMLGTVVTLCSLKRAPYPGPEVGSLLDGLLTQDSTGSPPQADIDVDGDGLEQVIADATGIIECIDGDGTAISGPNCPCDPRIADGYSVTFGGTAVRAYIVGVASGGTP